jgi:hypothetical protein
MDTPKMTVALPDGATIAAGETTWGSGGVTAEFASAMTGASEMIFLKNLSSAGYAQSHG